jgi:hypothetical protein
MRATYSINTNLVWRQKEIVTCTLLNQYKSWLRISWESHHPRPLRVKFLRTTTLIWSRIKAIFPDMERRWGMKVPRSHLTWDWMSPHQLLCWIITNRLNDKTMQCSSLNLTIVRTSASPKSSLESALTSLSSYVTVWQP